MKDLLSIPLDRVVYASGQTLLGADFRDAIEVNRQLQYWHNRAMHQAYGVVLPRQPALPAQDKLAVHPFFAYDVFGRPMILSEPLEMNLPECKDFIGSIFLMALAGNENGEAALHWHASSHGSPHLGVPLARVIYDKDGATIDPTFEPPYCRPLNQPKIAVGRVISVDNWSQRDGHWVTTIDTSAAGFVNPPVYFVQLQLPRRIDDFFIDSCHVGKIARASLEVEFIPSATYANVGGAAHSTAHQFNTWSAQSELTILWVGMEPHGALARVLEAEYEPV